MTKTQKMAALTQMLQGNLAGLQALKRAQDEEPIMFSVDRPPKGWIGNPNDERPVRVHYQLGDEDITEYLTYAQMYAKAKGVVVILPHNGRSGIKFDATVPPLNQE